MALRFRGLDAPVECVYWKGGSAPMPDPNAQIAAETAANRYNIKGPSGSQTWSTDANGQATQNIDLNPAEQQQYDTRNQIANQLLSGASSQIPQFINEPFSYDNQGSKAGQAAYQRQVDLLTPEFAKQDNSFEQRLANQGVPLGSEAYNDSLRQHENDKNFALTQAAQAAESEGAQLGLSERQQRYNELAAALGSAQVSPVQSYGTQAAPIDAAGAYQSANNAALAKYNAGVSQQNAVMGGLAGLGSAYLQYRGTPANPNAAGGEAATASNGAGGSGGVGSVGRTANAGLSLAQAGLNEGWSTGALGNQALNDAVNGTTTDLASTASKGAPATSSLGGAASALGSAYGLYGGLQQGGAAGYTQAGLSGAQLATSLGATGATASVAAVAPYVAIGTAAAAYLNKGFLGSGKSSKISSALDAFTQSGGIQKANLGRSGTFYVLPDGRVLRENEVLPILDKWVNGDQAGYAQAYQAAKSTTQFSPNTLGQIRSQLKNAFGDKTYLKG